MFWSVTLVRSVRGRWTAACSSRTDLNNYATKERCHRRSNRQLQLHYAHGSLEETIGNALAAAGKD